MNTATTSKGSSRNYYEKFVNIALVAMVAVVGFYALGLRYQGTVKAVDGFPRDEIALDVALRAFGAIDNEIGNGVKTQGIDCKGADIKQVICKATGNSLHIVNFETDRAMPEFKLHALRGMDGKLLELELAGVAAKLQSQEVGELLEVFAKPAK